MRLGLSGSTIKSWFQYRCERKTRYELMTPDDRAAVPIGDDGREKTWAILGVDFENRVVGRLARARRVLRPAPDKSHGRVARCHLAGFVLLTCPGSFPISSPVSIRLGLRLLRGLHSVERH